MIGFSKFSHIRQENQIKSHNMAAIQVQETRCYQYTVQPGRRLSRYRRQKRHQVHISMHRTLGRQLQETRQLAKHTIKVRTVATILAIQVQDNAMGIGGGDYVASYRYRTLSQPCNYLSCTTGQVYICQLFINQTYFSIVLLNVLISICHAHLCVQLYCFVPELKSNFLHYITISALFILIYRL